MIGRLFALCLLRTVSLIETPERPQQISWTVAEVGGSVNLSCPVCEAKIGFVAWYKQTPGFMFQTILIGSYGKTTFSEQFNNSRFRITEGDGSCFLTIKNISKEDEAFYICLSQLPYAQPTFNGTFLAVNDSRTKSFSVKQNPGTKTADLGASVNLQCSLLSKNKEKRIQCPGERTVHWFRAASGEPHPGYIYSDGNTSAECGERSCVYSLSKTIKNSSDSGTYYCAVVTCGKILFGQGTTIQIRPEPDPVVLVLGVLLACCVIMTAVLFYINKRKVCQDHNEAKGASCLCGHDKNGGAENLVALNFATKNVQHWRKNSQSWKCVYYVFKADNQTLNQTSQ